MGISVMQCIIYNKIHSIFTILLIIFCVANLVGANERRVLQFDLLSEENAIDISQIPWGVSPDELKKMVPEKFHTSVKYRNNKWRVADPCIVQKYVEDTDEKLHFTATLKHKSKLYNILNEHYVFYFGEKGLWAVVVLFISEHYPNSLKKDPIAKANITALTDRVKHRNKKLLKKYRKLYGKPSENRESELPKAKGAKNIQSKSIITRWKNTDNITIILKSTILSQENGFAKESLKETYSNESWMPAGKTKETIR